MIIGDGCSDVCSSDLAQLGQRQVCFPLRRIEPQALAVFALGAVEVAGESQQRGEVEAMAGAVRHQRHGTLRQRHRPLVGIGLRVDDAERVQGLRVRRSEEHKSELQSLMRSSYAVFCLKKKKKNY